MLYFEKEMLRIRTLMGYDTESSRRVVLARNRMEQSYAEALTMNSLAREVMVSPFLFSRRFRKLYGTSPAQYLSDVRIRESVTLLKQGVPVAEVCYRVGLGSPTSFAGLFKRKTGHPPSFYHPQKAGSER